MPSKPLPVRLQYAILHILMAYRDGTYQSAWGGWMMEVASRVPDAKPADLRANLKHLHNTGIIRLTKPDNTNRDAFEYPGNHADDEAFFLIGPFNATITDEGRIHWGNLNTPSRTKIFISHITEEKPVAHVLQKYLILALGNNFPVFVSSDGRSIGGGKKWYNYIIDNLRLSEVILVLVSQESKGREWINFEAGFGEGMESLVIPVGIKHMSLGQLPNPLAGIQARSIDDIGLILDDIGKRLAITPSVIDLTSYVRDIEEAEAALIYKSLKVQPAPVGSVLHFEIENVGNVDLELLMLEVCIPRSVAIEAYTKTAELTPTFRDGLPYFSFCCYSNRGACGHIAPVLRPVITPSMGKVRPSFAIPIRTDLTPSQTELAIFYQVGYSLDAGSHYRLWSSCPPTA